jgi:hypothetical protein
MEGTELETLLTEGLLDGDVLGGLLVVGLLDETTLGTMLVEGNWDSGTEGRAVVGRIVGHQVDGDADGSLLGGELTRGRVDVA